MRFLVLPVVAFLALPLSAPALTISGVQPAALDQPQVHMLLRREPGEEPLTDILELGFFAVRTAFLDTGASGVIFTTDTVDFLALSAEPEVIVTEIGIAGTADFGLAESLFLSVAPTSALVNISDPNAYDQSIGPVRAQLGGGSPVDIIGMPLIDNRVVVMDPKPLNLFITDGLLDTMRTYIYAPNTPYRATRADSDPGIPPTSLHVRLSFADFSSAVKVTPDGSPQPTLAANPFIGADPTAPSVPADAPPGVTISYQGVQGANLGSYLLDTGAAGSFISTAEAAKVKVRYRAGTEGSANPVLEFIDSGLAVPNQYQLTIGGVGGTLTVAGFLLESLTLQTVEGEPVVFTNAPVAVLDIGTDDLVLDGVLGMNFMLASAFFDGFNIGPFALGAFDFVVYDDQNAELGFAVAAQSASVTLELEAGLNIVSLPLRPQPPLTSHGLQSLIGADLISVHRLDPQAGLFATTSFTNGLASGADFPLLAGEGYLVEVAAKASLSLAGLAVSIETDLAAGLNIVGFHQPAGDFSAHKLLASIGDAAVVSSVARYNTTTGRYETASQGRGGITGTDFAIVAGEGYLLSMHQAISAVSVPRQISVSVEGSFP